MFQSDQRPFMSAMSDLLQFFNDAHAANGGPAAASGLDGITEHSKDHVDKIGQLCADYCRDDRRGRDDLSRRHVRRYSVRGLERRRARQADHDPDAPGYRLAGRHAGNDAAARGKRRAVRAGRGRYESGRRDCAGNDARPDGSRRNPSPPDLDVPQQRRGNRQPVFARADRREGERGRAGAGHGTGLRRGGAQSVAQGDRAVHGPHARAAPPTPGRRPKTVSTP